MKRFSKLISYTEKHFSLPLTMLLFSMTIILAFTFVDYFIYGKQTEKLALENAIKKSEERNRIFLSDTEHAKSILLSIRENFHFKTYLENPDTKNILQSLFQSVSASHHNVMQLRYIDAKGQEKIRIDRKNLNAKALPVNEQHLQNKSNRYYFYESLEKPEEVWFSSLDLNIEYGKVETPFKPTFRAILPIRKSDQFEGILILNLFAAPVLEQVLDLPLYETKIVDREGYILVQTDSTLNWSRYQKPQKKISAKFLQALETKLYTGKDFISRKLELPFSNQLYIIMKLKQTYVQQEQKVYFQRIFLVALMVFALSSLLTLLIHFVLNTLHKNISLTQEQLLESELKQKEQELLLIQQSKMAEMGELIGAIAHQWKQPISTLYLLAESILDKHESGTLNGEDLEMLTEKVKEQVLYMDTTITDFRDYFKPSTETVIFDAYDATWNMVKLVEHQFLMENVQVRIHQVNTFLLEGYPNEFMQVLLNLVKNARDAYSSMQAQVEKPIDIYLETTPVSAQIRVVDQAGGIPKEIMGKIFDPYFSTKGVEGTGIGLEICKKIIEDHFNGSLNARNHAYGAEFTIEVPLYTQKKQENS